jgi:hypothetical protein
MESHWCESMLKDCRSLIVQGDKEARALTLMAMLLCAVIRVYGCQNIHCPPSGASPYRMIACIDLSSAMTCFVQ